MADRGYPLIRGSIFKTDFYQSPKGGGGGDIRLPPRDPKKHRALLMEQLDALLARVRERPPGQRDPEASRELIAVAPKDTYDLTPAPLGDSGEDVRVLGLTEAGTALLDAKGPELVHLRRKIDAYADDSRMTDTGARKNAPAIAPIEEIRLASEADLIGPRLRAAKLEPTARRWFEIACRGGARSGQDSAASRTIGGLHGPDVLMEGGNVAFDGKLPDPFVETLTTLTTGREFLTRPLSRLCMTSEATARASGLAASIWAAEPSLLPATVRGLMVHPSTWTSAMKEQFPNADERLAICGLGVPDREFARACATDRATVVFEDEMPNAVPTKQAKKSAPKTSPGTPTETKLRRVVKFFRLPVPEELLLDDPDRHVELRVTLSYFPEPNTFRRQVSRGLDLKWDMQGPNEKLRDFEIRVNKLARGEGTKKPKGKSFKWELGLTRRSRGTVQSDRWGGPASYLAGHKHIAVVPVLGWWERRPALRELTMPFSLIVTVRAAGLDIYQPIRIAVEGAIEVTT